MRIRLSGILVDDQDRAKRFYTDVLGFKVKTDLSYGDSSRWLTVVSPEDTEGTELLLGLADEPGLAYQLAQREAGKPAISFSTDDCQRDYEALAARGVRFTLTPTTMGYGGTDAVFDDTCGNLVNLHQD